MKNNKKRIEEKIYCNPDVCPNCDYIGEGDSICTVTIEIVLDNWNPTDKFMGEGCLYVKNGKGGKDACADGQLRI